MLMFGFFVEDAWAWKRVWKYSEFIDDGSTMNMINNDVTPSFMMITLHLRMFMWFDDVPSCNIYIYRMVDTVVIHGRSSWKSTRQIGKSIRLRVVYHPLW